MRYHPRGMGQPHLNQYATGHHSWMRRNETRVFSSAGGIARHIGAVRKRTQLKGKLMGKTAWTERDKTDGWSSRACAEKRKPHSFDLGAKAVSLAHCGKPAPIG